MNALLVARCLACAFFGVLFLQSGFDKLLDWKGNLGWLTGHFEKSPVKNMVPLMLGTMTVVEISAGLCSVGGLIVLLVNGPAWVPILGIGLSGLALTMLFAGQRIAKDYEGAATLATYFGAALLSLLLMVGL